MRVHSTILNQNWNTCKLSKHWHFSHEVWVQIFNNYFLQTTQFDCLDFIVKVKTSLFLFLFCVNDHSHHNYCYFVFLYILVAVMVRQFEPLPTSPRHFSHVLLNLNSKKMGVHFRFVKGCYVVVSHKAVLEERLTYVSFHNEMLLNNEMNCNLSILISSVQSFPIAISKVYSDTAWQSG